MGGASLWHWIVVGLVVMLLFGRGKISEMMGDVAKGIKAFKKGMAEDETTATPATPPTTPPEPVRTIEHSPSATAPSAAAQKPAPFGENKAG